MPTRLLAVEHCVQEHNAGCLAACGQMILRYFGVEQSQRYLNQLLGLTSIGVPYTHISRLSELNMQVNLGAGEQSEIQHAIDRGQPIIAFLFTGDLPHWHDNTSHAVVIIGYDDTHCYLNDPAFPIAPQVVSWDAFLLAWSEMDYFYALIRPQRQIT